VARLLFEGGSLWNTFVMVGHVRGFLEMINVAQTRLVDVFRRNVKAFPGSRLWAGAEVHIQDSLYDRIPSVDFSREILAAQSQRLVAVRLDADWNDLGHPERVMDVLQAVGLKPWWKRAWQMPKRSSTTVAIPTTGRQQRD
jgi:mannose-1-phosphate guanylyltransferase